MEAETREQRAHALRLLRRIAFQLELDLDKHLRAVLQRVVPNFPTGDAELDVAVCETVAQLLVAGGQVDASGREHLHEVIERMLDTYADLLGDNALPPTGVERMMSHFLPLLGDAASRARLLLAFARCFQNKMHAQSAAKRHAIGVFQRLVVDGEFEQVARMDDGEQEPVVRKLVRVWMRALPRLAVECDLVALRAMRCMTTLALQARQNVDDVQQAFAVYFALPDSTTLGPFVRADELRQNAAIDVLHCFSAIELPLVRALGIVVASGQLPLAVTDRILETLALQTERGALPGDVFLSFAFSAIHRGTMGPEGVPAAKTVVRHVRDASMRAQLLEKIKDEVQDAHILAALAIWDALGAALRTATDAVPVEEMHASLLDALVPETDHEAVVVVAHLLRWMTAGVRGDKGRIARVAERVAELGGEAVKSDVDKVLLWAGLL